MTKILKKPKYSLRYTNGWLNLKNTSPQMIGEAVEELKSQHDGTLTPEQLLEASKPKSAPLHDVFEWDDTAAGKKYRIHQARNLIASIAVTYEGEKEPRIANVSVKEQNGDRHYVSTSFAMTQPQMKIQVLKEALDYLRGAKNRFGQLRELSGVVAAIDEFEKKIKDQIYRKCLKCDNMFESDGPSNRLCIGCNTTNKGSAKLSRVAAK